MVRIEINGVEIEVEQGTMVIEAADAVEVPIPRFCYHKKLSIAANCRMCLVEVEKAPKPLPACATPVTDGMKVWTNSEKAKDAQRSVMEFLLINHPLDCPICDQGGECELQDNSLGYGKDISRFTEEKRVVADKNLGPLIATDMTRCIHCTRCVRFGDEIAGIRELGAVGRGENTKITTFIEQNVNSEVSGNVIDLCPVGALTSKPYRFTARAWELTSVAGISPHDCIGSNIYYHVRGKNVMRVVPRENEEINEVWIADRDRYSYTALQHEDRARKPMLKSGAKWQNTSWIDTLKNTTSHIENCLANHGPTKIGALVSPSISLEEGYLFQKYLRSFKCENIDHRLTCQDFRDQDLAPLYPNLGIDFAELEEQNAILLVGSSIHKELPLAGLKLIKACNNGATVAAINPVDYSFNFPVLHKDIVPHGDMLTSLAAITKVLLATKSASTEAIHKEINGLDKLLAAIQPQKQHTAMAEMLSSNPNAAIILGRLALTHPDSSRLIALANIIAALTDSTFGGFSDGANAAGCWMTGCVPHRYPAGKSNENSGLNVAQMLETDLRVLFLVAIEPELDTLWGAEVLDKIKQVDVVIAFATYTSATLNEIADIILPITPHTECFATKVNIDGLWQSTTGSVQPFDESRPLWKVLRVLGNLISAPGFEYTNAQDVLEEIRTTIGDQHPPAKWHLWAPADLSFNGKGGTMLIPEYSLYAIDCQTRRSMPLQQTADALTNPTAKVHSSIAANLQVDDGMNIVIKSKTGKITIPVEIDDRVPENSIQVPMAIPATINLGKPYQLVEVSSA